MKSMMFSSWEAFEEYILNEELDVLSDTKTGYAFQMDDQKLVHLFKDALDENEEKFPGWWSKHKKEMHHLYDRNSGRYGHMKRILDFLYAQHVVERLRLKGKS